MAIDGSFCLESELKRFLVRCPKLGVLPEFVNLTKKGLMLTEEDAAYSVAELFLNPNYSIALLGCFRPITRMVLDRTVALLRLVPNLRSNSNANMYGKDEISDDAEAAKLIEIYVRKGWGLNLHELACFAFSRALDLSPHLLGAVLSYFQFAPPPFERILVQLSVPDNSAQARKHLLDAIQTSYRLLLLEPEVFSKLWDWSCFLDLVHQSSSLNFEENVDCDKNDMLEIKWCVIQILSIILKNYDQTTSSLDFGAEEELTCSLLWKKYREDVSLEKASWYFEPAESKTFNSIGDIDLNHENCLKSIGISSLAISSSQFLDIEPATRSRRLESWNAQVAGNPFVMTSAVKKSFEIVLLAVSQKWPVLLYGPAGAGKTALINKLALDSKNRVLSIHMDDQLDSKTLMGCYVCTDQPGEFRWQPGSLTQAVLNGFWVVFEDIDKAPTDVLSILLPLLEGASSFATGHGEAIRVAEGFRMFSTVSSSNLDISGRYSLGVLWRRVMIRHSSKEDLQQIVGSWYPSLKPIVEKLVETFEMVTETSLHQLAGFSSEKRSSFGSLSRFSLRDLLKWCKRLSGFDFSITRDGFSAYQLKCIYQEAVDIFAAFSTSIENRLRIMRGIAKVWAVPVSEAETLFPLNKPIIQDFLSELGIGRISLQRIQTTLHSEKKPFVGLRSSLHILEKIACSVKFNEPVLLVGETGTGKTTLVQNLALRIGQKLTVLNLSQQTDIADLLGGFKPMDAQFVCFQLYKEFESLFTKTFSAKINSEYLARVQKYLSEKNWKMLLSGFKKCFDFYRTAVEEATKPGSSKKRKKLLDDDVQKAWEKFNGKVKSTHGKIGASAGMLFSFVEGAFVTALRNGEWILLDEVNLAPPETLQRIMGVLEGENGSFCLAERGDIDYIHRHPNFRVFACMNPATDAGKRDLPYSLRSRFSEYFVDDVLDQEDLTLFISQFMDDSHSNKELVNKIVHFYKESKKKSDERLQDGANQKPQYSLRSLYRALEYTQKAKRKFGFPRAIYDGFSMFFLNLLDRPSSLLMNKMILTYLLGGNVPSHIPFDDYLVAKAKSSFVDFVDNYVLTKSVKEHLKNLARAVFIKRYPVLLQGPTSSGKTSLVHYLAALTGHKFVRINNHEHTDLQEYLGFYITDAYGKLVFHEGALVKAVRNGHWIVLDELNLAPSDVLEALNRLLDDNREIFIPELRETIQAHPDFMLFATQNPPTFYGGRKMLSRAFRNRFVEIHVEEIPEDELSIILENRCKIPLSYATKMVEVMKELQLQRQSSKVFAGKHGFITPRDLFRWADRFRTFGTSYEDLARDGYYLLAERLRDDDEKATVQQVLEKNLRVKLVKDGLYKQESGDFNFTEASGVSESLKNIAFTQSMRRLLFLVDRCYKLREPVILVGETGGGKTTICQLLSIILGLKLHILNCHQYTETSDFLGGFHPIRERSTLAAEYTCLLERVMLSKIFIQSPMDVILSLDISRATVTLNQLDNIVTNYRQNQIQFSDVTLQDVDAFVQMRQDLGQLQQKWQTIFTWQDGPLIQAMKDGDLFLVDEISLADDSVLERLNSVLEPERKISLAEKGGSDLEKITAHPNFFLLATMNPGGDYGKKELSPALRNRFTEIWVPAVNDLSELRSIALQRISTPTLSMIVNPMLTFWKWFNGLQIGRVLTTRDLLSWVAFIDVAERSLQPEYALLHGVFLVLLDGLSLGTGISKSEARELREKCLSFLLGEIKVLNSIEIDDKLSRLESYGWGDIEFNRSCTDMICDNVFGIYPFFIEKGNEDCEDGQFDLLAPTTRRNALRVLRAMQLAKPVLLEGSPGVGKTSLIVALGILSGHKVVRINLSEQTDIMDLLGSDLPVESEEGIKFAWSDGILLQALKNGFWVLLDELNLAPQSVLEGLNAILDHRAEVFIPDLGRTFKCPPSFRVFACQNPSSQGGGRKGLPKSFLNRFTKVYVDELVDEDYLSISSSLFPSISVDLLTKLIIFNKRLHEETMLNHKFAHDGSPWEFNLRDVVRSCQIIQCAPEMFKSECFLNLVYVQRMRTPADRKEVLRLYEEIFETKPFINPYPRVQLNPQCLFVGSTTIVRNRFQSSKVLTSQLKILPQMRNSFEAVAQCVQNQWLCILIGPPSSGKTSIIRLLAQLTGNVLNELNLSPATDISELLGCFEQYNAFRIFRSVVAEVERYMNEYCSLQLKTISKERKDLIRRWFKFLSSLSCGDLTENWRSVFNSISLLVEIVEELRVFLAENERTTLSLLWSNEDLKRIHKKIMNLQDNGKNKPFSVKFEWVTGLLINAIENGEWIILENANLCNPTVLDRINSLVEPSGSITVNECGTIDGKPVVVHPHSNFRIFLTVNPTYGEVSRAMRNRGVEIFLMQPNWLLERQSVYFQEESEHNDLKRFLVLSGIPGDKLVNAMVKAHIYAKDEGLRHNVEITTLELARWVQLFQQLISNGNSSRWSLQISWDHTYLSAFGEAQVEEEFIFSLESLFDSSLGSSLCLPGGWPIPLMIKDMVLYSKEASLRQHFMYLEFIGSQCASYQSGNSQTYKKTHLFDLKMLNQVMFPDSSNEMLQNDDWRSEFDLSLGNKILFFASNWTIEQAAERDIDLYLHRFSWFKSQLEPFSQFFDSFLSLLKKELKHPIWNYILRYHQKLFSCPKISWVVSEENGTLDLNVQPIPLLSLDAAVLTESNDKPTSELLCNAIKCVSVLRSSFRQWNTEEMYNYSDKLRVYSTFLKSLRVLEENVLGILVESPCFDDLIKLYTDLIEDHISFWNSATSSYMEEYLLIFWRSLVKAAVKLKRFCPKTVQAFLVESMNLDNVSAQKSMLWAHGGHPLSPSSSDLYKKQYQLLSLCESIWPRKMKSLRRADNHLLEVVSSNPELRLLAMQGVGMSSYITSKFEEDSAHTIQQLEEIHQMLLQRVEHEKEKMAANTLLVGSSANCCTFSSELMCCESGFTSWQETLPIVDISSSCLDMELLQALSKTVLADAEELHQDLSRITTHLDSSVNFSLNFSSRPPTCFVPHQKILWTLDAWTSMDAASTKLAGYALEMWFSWHSTLWNPQPACVKSFFKVEDDYIPVPDMLLQPIRTATTAQILKSAGVIKDYHLHRLKLKAASFNLWQSYFPRASLSCFLLSAARSLFQQIIYAHRKSFKAEFFFALKSLLCSLEKNLATNDNIQVARSLIASSNHRKLTSMMDLFIEPLLRELYQECPATELFHNLGCAWLRIGGLRFHLLIQCDDLDPALKYSCKYSQLTEKISSLELEIRVRKKCDHLAGSFSTRESDREKLETLNNLEVERKNMQRKIVFRADPGKFKKLKYESDEFRNLINSATDFITNVKTMDLRQIINHVRNWQETTTSFINRLSDEYPSYMDIIQPVQVAIYEMKLGLSLVLSSELQKEYLKKVEQDNMDLVLETIYSFMRFPRGFAFKSNAIKVERKEPSYSVEFSTDFGAKDVAFIEKLASMPRDSITSNILVSQLQQKATIYQIILVRLARSVADAKLLDNVSFGLLDEIFSQFASLWINMKQEAKDREENEALQFKFKPRVFKIESIFESNTSTLGDISSSESYQEWQEFLYQEELNVKKEDNGEDDSLVEEWNFMQECILKKLVCAHNQLFGSSNVSLNAEILHKYDAESLLSFTESYTLGVGMIKGLEGFSSNNLDARLVPEHLLHISVEHEHLFATPQKTINKYNFYKDSNAPLMAKMVDLLASLKARALVLLNDWEDHPGVKKILDVIEMLLAIPLTTPMSKALSGLQFLRNRVQILQESISKFSLSDEIQPIIILASLWRKMEYESWPALLDEVQDEYDTNAGKLWFPLYSVLFRYSNDIDEYNQFTIQSVVEFIQTSSIGEFKKRLHLLYAFHGQIKAGISLGSYSSPCHLENVKILYNVFGYYMQFLPIISEHILVNRKAIEKEIKELLKLCKWDRPEIDNSTMIRQKLKKLIQKFNDLLQQPVMIILTQEEARQAIMSSTVKNPDMPKDVPVKNALMLDPAFDITNLSEDRCVWYATWRKEINSSFQILLGKTSEAAEEVSTLDSLNIYHDEWKTMWLTMETVCSKAVDYGERWKDSTIKISRKKWALSDLLKLLESCGLSKHRPMYLENQNKSKESSGLFLQPSFNMQHLLLAQSILSKNGDIKTSPPLEIQSKQDHDSEWRLANQYYFMSIASVQRLRQICLSFHKEFTLEEVNRTGSFLDHLIVIQQDQRQSAYDFSEQLKSLKKCVASLEILHQNTTTTECLVLETQHATFKCMWQQKHLFDSFCATLNEESLLLRTVENSHINSCPSVKAETSGILAFIDRFAPTFQTSKESLDNYLLDHNGMMITLTDSLHPYVIPREMNQLVVQNFQALKEFEGQLHDIRMQNGSRSVKEVLLSHFDDIFLKGKLMAEEFYSSLEMKNGSTSGTQLEQGALQNTLKTVMETFQNICSISNRPLSDEALEHIPSWGVLFDSYKSKMQFDLIHRGLMKIILPSEKSLPVETHLKSLLQLTELLLKFGEGLLHDFLAVHKTVSVMTHVLAKLFASLYSKGFGTSAENEGDDANCDKSQDASGTGMGEGEGRNDVSDQITDEDQLLGTQQKNEEKDASNELPSKNDKGIEMEEDFTADAFDVSEDSDNDNNNEDQESEDEKIDSAMGDTGGNDEIVDEKLWDDKEDEDNPDNSKEKKESGPSVTDKDPGSRELSAKDDCDANEDDEHGDIDPENGKDKSDEKESPEDGLDETKEMEGMNNDKDDSLTDNTGLKIDELNQDSVEDMEVDEEQENANPTEETCTEEKDSAEENLNNEEENPNLMDENADEVKSEPADKETDNLGNENENEDSKMDLDSQKVDVAKRENLDVGVDNSTPKEARSAQSKVDFQAADSASAVPEEKWSNSTDINNDLAPIRGLPSSTNTDMVETMATDSSEGGKLSDPPKSQLGQNDSSARKNEPNPYRNVGDALEKWKERVKASIDLPQVDDKDTEMADENAEDDKDADEYGFVSEKEKGTAQALGPATSDQMNNDINDDNNPDGDGPTTHKDDVENMDIEQQNIEKTLSTNTSVLRPHVEKQVKLLELEELPNEVTLETHGNNSSNAHESVSDGLVTIRKSYMSEDISQLSELSLSDNDFGKAQNLEPMSSEMKENATILWRKYELQTTRLSQELAEQLRLVMEPTLASKLQGDYKTGKRINMKKVIPYIASHYRKDKIWLRRTRPNKRDYQVVIAVDDSRSMSENCCGDVAIESLVTVCRAMSQLEVGNLAVASYGKKGNIKLLHDFDQPFSGEAGVKMISSLTFQQENTIRDEPVVDLLNYLNNMLDAAVSNARLPSGHNPLQQLVLIIADGQFHEKQESLKRCVRDVLSKKRMVAVLLLDSPKESIMDLQVVPEASLQGGNFKLTKYLDSFPFPYYIVLKNIEALPRTLADLLRQWFELMQNSRE